MSLDLSMKAVDLIFKALPLLKSLTGARRREYFERAIQPLFSSLEEVHGLYNDLFLATRASLVQLSVQSTPFLGDGPRLTVDGLKSLRAIKDDFLQKRSRDESLRDGLRQEAQDIFHALSWEEERRFVASVAYYFLGQGGISPTDAELNQDIENVIAKGGLTAWPTPSLKLYNDVRASLDIDAIVTQIDEARDRLNQLYMNVRHHFVQVRHVVIMRT